MTFVEDLAALGGMGASRRFTVPWGAIQADLGVELPPDYIEYVNYFGPGTWSGCVNVLMPGVEDPAIELRHQSKKQQALLQEHPTLRDSQQWPVHPEPSGLLRWGVSTISETFSWLV